MDKKGDITQFEEIYEKIPIGIGIVNKDGQVIHMNEEMLRIAGWEREDIKSFHVQDHYYNNDDREKILKILQQNGEVNNYEVRLLKKDHTKYWALVSIKPILYGDEQVLMVTQVDITERKKMQKILDNRNMKIQKTSIISMISTIFIHNSKSFKEKIESSLKIFGNALKSEFTAIIRNQDHNSLIHETNEIKPSNGIIDAFWKYQGNDIVPIPIPKDLNNTLNKLVQNFKDNIPKNLFQLYSFSDFNNKKALQKVLKKYNFNSIMLIPIFLTIENEGNQLYGVLIAIDRDKERDYDLTEIHMGIEVSIIFNLALKNQFEEHKIMYKFDQMGGREIGSFIALFDEKIEVKKIYVNDYITKLLGIDTNDINIIDKVDKYFEKDVVRDMLLIHQHRIKGKDLPRVYSVNLKTLKGEKPFYFVLSQGSFRNQTAVFGYMIPNNDKEVLTPKEIIKKYNLEKN